MGDMGGLPALSDPRLIILQKQSRRMRKGIAIKNDKLRAHRDRVDRMEEKYKTSESFRAWQRTLPYKNSLAEIRGLQKVLKKRRESTMMEFPTEPPAPPDSLPDGLTDRQYSTFSPPPSLPAANTFSTYPAAAPAAASNSSTTTSTITFPRNGIYDGATLDSMRREVDQVIREKNPRERRLRKVERIKNNGLTDGRIIDPEAAMDRFSQVLSRPKGLTRNERDVSCRLSLNYGGMDDDADAGPSLLRGRHTFSPTLSTSSSERALSIAGSPAPPSPVQFRLPPIQARRSTLANVAAATRPGPRLFDIKSDRSDPSTRAMKRSMSFAVAR